MAVPLPMNVGNAESELFERVFVAVEERGAQEARDASSLMRLQLARHGEYVSACAKIEAFSDSMRALGTPLVPLRFPIRLTSGTRESVQTGVHRSFVRFLQDLYEVVLVQHGHVMDDACTDMPALLEQLAGALTLAQCNVLDGEAAHAEAVKGTVRHAERCRLAAVRAESEALLGIGNACEIVAAVLRDFGRTMVSIGKSKVASRFCAFLNAAERRGLREAGEALMRVRHIADAFEGHAWLSGAKSMDDAQLVRAWELLKLSHRVLADALTWEVRRVRWLVATNPGNQCWCGLALESGYVGSLVCAPAHMRSFATGQRVRVVRETDVPPFTCRLSAACVTNLLVELLREGHLVLDRISAGYATRILTFDFCKYEKMAQFLLDDEVRPWVESVRKYLVELVTP